MDTQLINNKGGMNIQGLINEYVCKSPKITAGEFVNYINEFSQSHSLQINTKQSSADNAYACVLDDERVFITHRIDANNSGLGGDLVSVTNNKITSLKQYTLFSTSGLAVYSKCIAIDNTRVLTTYGDGSNGNYLCGCVWTIDETGYPTKGTPVKLTNGIQASAYYNLLKIGENKILVIHSSGNDAEFIHGTILNIEESTIKPTTSTLLCNVGNSSINMDSVLIDTNKVMVVHGTDRTLSKLGAFIVNINGDTLTANADKILLNVDGKGTHITACKIGTNRVLVCHCFDKTSTTLGAIVINANGNSVTASEDVEYSKYKLMSGMTICLVPYSDNEALLLFNEVLSVMDISAMLIAVEDNTIIKFNSVLLNNSVGAGNRMHGVRLNDGRLFLVHKSHQSPSYLTGVLGSIKKEATTITSKEQFQGVAVETKSQGQSIKIAVPKV